MTPRDGEAGRPSALVAFGGSPGNLALVAGLPVIAGALYFAVGFNGGAVVPRETADVAGFWRSLVPTPAAVAFYLGWFALQALFQAVMPGRVVEGSDLPGGGRLRYRMNGPASVAVTLVLASGLHLSGVFDLGFLHAEFGALLTTATLFSFGLSGFLYFYGKRHGQYRGTGRPIRDFFMGTGHNPRIPPHGLFDLKFFCEARPGLILWMLVDASFAIVQYRTYGFVSTSMILVCAFQWMYVLDYYRNEPAVLTTMDIKHENFGFMLVFGDLVWVPMTYSVQAFYLIHHMHDLPPYAAAGIVALNLLGLSIFRAVNNQKNRFRRSPDDTIIWGKPARYLETASGAKLLLSGFWGWSRHFNYVGDALMALAWSLPCGFGAAAPYFYPVYFAALLVHRERRDAHFCRRKYGADWDRYCQEVPWRIVPGIY